MTAQQLQTLQAELDARDKALKAQADALHDATRTAAQLDAEIKTLKAEVAQAKKLNEAVPDTHDYSEAETRDFFIDLLLREAGWPLTKTEDREYPVDGMPNNQGKGFVDYVLWGDNGLPLAVVEAKRTKKDPRIGQQQAKLYADCLQANFGQRPLIFYTNGYETWLWDDRMYPPRPVQGFYKKDETGTPRPAPRVAQTARAGEDQRGHCGAPVPAACHPRHCRFARKAPAQSPRGHGDGGGQDAHRNRPVRPAAAQQLDQARPVPRGSRGPRQSGSQRLQSASARKHAYQPRHGEGGHEQPRLLSTYPTMMGLIDD